MEYEYSIDMVRLRCRVKSWALERYFNRLGDMPDIEYWFSSKFKQYAHNWKIKKMQTPFDIEPVVAYVGFRHNAERHGSEYSMVVEFNPNKFIIEGLLKDILINFFGDWFEVLSVDVAIDFEENINNVIVDKERKRAVKTFEYGGDNKTIYIGEGDGRVKIYNKAKQMGLTDKTLTRYEISLKVKLAREDIYLYELKEVSMPKIYILGQLGLYNPTDVCLIYGIMAGFSIDQLKRNKRKKIKEIMNSMTEFKVDNEKVENLIKDYFKEWLL